MMADNGTSLLRNLIAQHRQSLSSLESASGVSSTCTKAPDTQPGHNTLMKTGGEPGPAVRQKFSGLRSSQGRGDHLSSCTQESLLQGSPVVVDEDVLLMKELAWHEVSGHDLDSQLDLQNMPQLKHSLSTPEHVPVRKLRSSQRGSTQTSGSSRDQNLSRDASHASLSTKLLEARHILELQHTQQQGSRVLDSSTVTHKSQSVPVSSRRSRSTSPRNRSATNAGVQGHGDAWSRLPRTFLHPSEAAAGSITREVLSDLAVRDVAALKKHVTDAEHKLQTLEKDNHALRERLRMLEAERGQLHAQVRVANAHARAAKEKGMRQTSPIQRLPSQGKMPDYDSSDPSELKSFEEAKVLLREKDRRLADQRTEIMQLNKAKAAREKEHTAELEKASDVIESLKLQLEKVQAAFRVEKETLEKERSNHAREKKGEKKIWLKEKSELLKELEELKSRDMEAQRLFLHEKEVWQKEREGLVNSLPHVLAKVSKDEHPRGEESRASLAHVSTASTEVRQEEDVEHVTAANTGKREQRDVEHVTAANTGTREQGGVEHVTAQAPLKQADQTGGQGASQQALGSDGALVMVDVDDAHEHANGTHQHVGEEERCDSRKEDDNTQSVLQLLDSGLEHENRVDAADVAMRLQEAQDEIARLKLQEVDFINETRIMAEELLFWRQSSMQVSNVAQSISDHKEEELLSRIEDLTVSKQEARDQISRLKEELAQRDLEMSMKDSQIGLLIAQVEGVVAHMQTRDRCEPYGMCQPYL